MPATFPSHQGFVLPLKVWRPQWFDGVALVVGAASPDVSYVLEGTALSVWPWSHQVPWFVLWCLPVTLLLSGLARRCAAGVAVHLPVVARDYGVLSTYRPSWPLTVTSALLGAASHLLADAVFDGPRAAIWAGHLFGAVLTLAALVHIGRRRLLVDWHGPAPARPRRPSVFWGSAAVVAVIGLTILPGLPRAWQTHTTGTRMLAVAALALLAGAATVRVTRRRARAGCDRTVAAQGRMEV